ncbi:Diadenosine tetraphosphate (Ap4A) hydrolase [Syntrophus gentianae]|uniref:Diadenosine tetraphosphate (Ap4A) hydrolase n=1 Tax=Syntrophus gentianae TaxID=43775 RepID=A0A1H7XEQ0_9BACT|nr:HIT domain-containing protein [Syntrophus gentianae]SEM32201.1 Diadenosine tetraphosphate (Ap4A) hydrolase [Syntrophus gentianae]
MKSIYAPWRMAYIKGEKVQGCVFCKESIRDDSYVLLDGKTAFVMLNAYPYTNGHLLIIPFRHLSSLEALLPEERLEMFSLVDISVRVLKETMSPDGFNIGMNLGRAAGAGIDDHLHIHVVPRWNGDTNFMSVVGDIRVIPDDILKSCEELKGVFSKYRQED